MYLEHVNLTVGNLDRSIDFYCKLFDYKVRWRTEPGDPEPAAHVGNEREYVAFFESTEQGGSAPHNYSKVGINHFGFVVEDLTPIRLRLDELDLQPHHEGSYNPGKRLYFFDPDGIEIEVVEYDSTGNEKET